MTFPLPTIGSRGSYEALPPYDTVILPTDVYICKGIRKLSDYLAMNEDPKTFIYQYYGMSEEDYNNDLKADVEIISLQSDRGVWVYVPINRIRTYPQVNGIEYRAKSIVIKLPLIKESSDIASLVSDLSDMVLEHLGVTPEVSVVNLTRPTLLTSEASDTLETQRMAARPNDRTLTQKIINYQNTIIDLRNKISELEDYIKTRL